MKYVMMFLIMFLMQVSLSFGVAQPTYEYTASSDELQSMRSSAAVKEDYINGFSDVSAFAKNTKKVVITGIPAVTLSTFSGYPDDWYNAVDTFNDRIFLSGSGSTYLYTTDPTDTGAQPTLVNCSTQADVSDFYNGLTAPAHNAVQLSATTALLSIGDYAKAYSAETPLGKIYRTADNFTSFTEVLSTDYGHIFLGTPYGDMITAWAYHGKADDSGLAQTVWLSEDSGLTWVMIDQNDHSADLSSGDLPESAHTHRAIVYDSDTIIVAYGDSRYAQVKKLTRPTSWDEASEWDEAWVKFDGVYLAGDPEIIDDDLWIPNEGFTQKDTSLIRYNLLTDTAETVLTIPSVTTTVDYKYTQNGAYPALYGMVKIGGVYCVSASQLGAASPAGGLYVSPDGYNWTCLLRRAEGIRRIVGEWDGKLLAQSYDSGDTNRLTLITIPSVRLVDAVVAEKAPTNLISVFDGTVNDSWQNASTLDWDSSVLSSGLYSSENGILLTSDDNSSGASAGDGVMQSLYIHSTAPTNNYIAYPSAGDYVSFSFDFKVSGEFQDLSYANRKYFEFATTVDVTNGAKFERYYIGSTNWHHVFKAIKVGTPGDATAMQFKLYDEGSSPLLLDGATVKLQNVQMYYDVERFDRRTYTPATLTKADDYAIAPLTGLGSSWTVTFDWNPLNGNLAFPYSETYPTLPIATIRGSNGKYLALYWDRNVFASGGMVFKLTDGLTTIALAPSEAMTWLHYDTLKFGITSDGTDTILYCFNPENAEVHAEADWVLSASDAAILDVPVDIVIGANVDEDLIGCGAYTNVRAWDTVLSASDVTTVFSTIHNMKSTAPTASPFGLRR